MDIALIGYGKMGRLIEHIALERGHKIQCIIDIDNQEDFHSKAFKNAQVAIEFTTPQTAYGNILKAFNEDVKVVTGSTGWMEEHGKEVERLCRQEGHTLFWSSNFSLGVYLFNKLNSQLAKLMNPFPQYDAEITETHHVHKLDAPSGTAITLAENLMKGLERKTEWVKGSMTAADGSFTPALETDGEKLKINSIREGEVAGIHTVSYRSPVDEISITHEAFGREGFALGAVLAAEYALAHEGLLTMDDLFKN